MGEHELEMVRHVTQTFARGDLEGSMVYTTDRSVLVNDSDVAGLSGVYHGRQGVRDLISQIVEAFDEYRNEPLEYSDRGNRVLVRQREVGRGRFTGMEIDRSIWQVWTIEGNEIVRLEVYSDREKAIRAAGVDG
jgi:ketosteroid isomerase-like protein